MVLHRAFSPLHLLLVVLLLLHPELSPPTNCVRLDCDAEWRQFKLRFDKTYASEAEERVRQLAFEHNLEKIVRHNIRHDLGQHSYALGVNQFADLMPAEYRQLMLGLRGGDGAGKGAGAQQQTAGGRRGAAAGWKTFVAPPVTANYRAPATLDWRQHGYVTPVKNQGQCGSCWAFSTTGSLEAQHMRRTGRLVSLSEQNLVDCSSRFGNHGCEGGLMDFAFQYIRSNRGIDTEASYPYRAADGKCRYNATFSGATLSGFVDIESGNETKLALACAMNGPISVAIDASHSSFQFYKHGVYNETLCSPQSLDHGVLVVGYGVQNGRDYWIVKNSWGTSWGLDGYILMSRNAANQCGIATQASYPLVQ